MITRFALPLALASLLLAAPTLAQPPAAKAPQAADAEFRDPTNAALLYSRAFMLLPTETNKKLAGVSLSDNPSWTPDTGLCRELAEAEGFTGTLLRAARIESSDFGIEYSQGINALLPHLGNLRHCAKFLAADARRLIREQHPDDAADRIAAIFSMSRHLRTERLLISSLVSSAIHTLAVAETDHLINSGQLTSSAKTRLLKAMDDLDRPDPFGIKAAVRGERYWVVVWIRDQVNGPAGVKVITEQILPILDENAAEQDLKAIREMDAAAVNADLDTCEPYYTAVIEAFDAPDAPARLAALEQKVKDGGFGLLARHVAPAMTKAHKQYTDANTRCAEARARLAGASARP